MIMSPAEKIAVRRAVVAYRAMRDKTSRGAFRGETADEILEALHPTPGRWVTLAAFVVAEARSDTTGRR